MSDITDLFHRIAPVDDDAGPSPEMLQADIARGHQALARDHRRRTIRRSMAATSTIAAAAVVAVIVAQVGGSTPHHAAALTHPKTVVKTHNQTKHHASAAKHPAIKPIKLVAYSGKQLTGFTVDKVPAGWSLSTSTQYALLIDPNGDTDNDPDAFVGKLAVLTQSSDVHGLGNGTKVTVNGQPGVVSDQGKYGLSLSYNDAGGFGVVIQAPASLSWTDDQLVAFADGVHVTGNAIPSRG